METDSGQYFFLLYIIRLYIIKQSGLPARANRIVLVIFSYVFLRESPEIPSAWFTSQYLSAACLTQKE